MGMYVSDYPDDDGLEPRRPRRPRRPRWVVPVVLFLTPIVGVFLLVAGYTATCAYLNFRRTAWQSTSADQSAVAPAPSVPGRPTAYPGPYPESALLLASLKKIVDDPDSLEIIHWGAPQDDHGSKLYVLAVRTRNRFGAKERQQWQAWISDGEITRWYRAATNTSPGEYFNAP